MASRLPVVAVAALGIALSGCALNGVESRQAVWVETPGCAAASCELRNDRGTWLVSPTPGSVDVTTSRQPLQVTCRAEGGAAGSGGAPSSVSPARFVATTAGGLAGGAVAGATFGSAALAFIPVLGVIILATGVSVGALAGSVVDTQGRPLTYPEVVSVAITCAAPGVGAGAGSASNGLAPVLPLGLEVAGLTVEEARTAGLGDRTAVRVLAVTAGGQAAAAGLRSGDVILRCAGHEVSDPVDFEQRIRSRAPGSALALVVWRNGRPQDLLLAPIAGAP
jgi:hypothetical protein